jgi:cyclase
MPQSGHSITTSGTLETIELAEGVYTCVGASGNSNSGFVVGRRSVLVVDTRLNPSLARELEAAIRQVTDKPITHVVNTHFHGDHTFGNQIFGDRAAVIASTLTRDRLVTEGESHLEWLSGFFKVDYSEVEVTPPNTAFDGAMTVDLGGRSVELIETAAGHTGGDVMVWVPEAKALFTGDVLVVNQIPWLGHSPGTARLMKDLLDLTDRRADTFVPGHGFNVTTVRREKIFSFLGFLQDVREQVTRLIDGGADLTEVIARVDLSRYKGWRMSDNKDWVAGNLSRLYQELTAPNIQE